MRWTSPIQSYAVLTFLLATLNLFLAWSPPARAASPENILYMDLDYGRVTIEMRPDLAPNHVRRIRELTRAGFYDGLVFHRVIAGFMAQTGDPKGNGTGGSGQNLQAEFSGSRHLRGTVSMARASDPHSADSQFFICFKPAPFLDGQYTIWGQVIDGMAFVDKIKKGDKSRNGVVQNPDRILRMHIKADGESTPE